MNKKLISLVSMLSLACACSPIGNPVSYEVFSSDEAESLRKIIHSHYQNKDWEKTDTYENSKLELLIGQTKDEFDYLLRVHGFQPVGGTNLGLPYFCGDDLCRCSKSKITNYARSRDFKKSFETIALQYGPKTFDGVCRSGLFSISSVDKFENNNAKNK